MGIISAIVFGLLAGIVAKMLMPGKDPGGFIITAILGIVGGLIGHFIANMMGMGAPNTWNLMNFLFAVGGAMLLLLIYRLVTKNKTRRTHAV